MCIHNSRSSCSVGNVFPSSEKKYCSGTGWPSFSEAHGASGSDESNTGILRRVDTSLGSVRTEVVCKKVSFFVITVLFSPMLPQVPQRALLSLAYVVVTEARWISTHATSGPSLPSSWALQIRGRPFLATPRSLSWFQPSTAGSRVGI